MKWLSHRQYTVYILTNLKLRFWYLRLKNLDENAYVLLCAIMLIRKQKISIRKKYLEFVFEHYIQVKMLYLYNMSII